MRISKIPLKKRRAAKQISQIVVIVLDGIENAVAEGASYPDAIYAIRNELSYENILSGIIKKD